MVDVGDKSVTKRLARASGRIVMLPATLALIRAGDSKKGDVLGVARIAAIQSSKRTADLIPLCHPLPLTRVAVEFAVDDAAHAVTIEVTAETVRRTGVEREALPAAAFFIRWFPHKIRGASAGWTRAVAIFDYALI